MGFLDFLSQDPLFFWLVWAAFTVSGVIVGWFLRAAFPETEVRNALQRTEQERNSTARLYIQLKHQNDLREADFKRVSLELNNFRQYVAMLESERNARSSTPEQEARSEKAEANAVRLAANVAALESVTAQLQQKNSDLEAQLRRANEELTAWQVLYRDFQSIQQRLATFEQRSSTLELERQDLLEQLKAARIEIENLQLEIVNQKPVPARKSAARSDHQGGPAAPEQSDDLKIINGITPFAERQLNALGIHTFLQISHWDDEGVLAFAKALNISPSKIFQEDWVGQAKHLTRNVRE